MLTETHVPLRRRILSALSLLLLTVLVMIGVPESHSAQVIATGFDYPVGDVNGAEYWSWQWLNDRGNAWHPALDINIQGESYADFGKPVYAVAEGVVESKGSYSGWGKVLVIRHQLPGGTTVWSQYGHLKDYAPNTEVGQTVGRRQHIGSIGDGDGQFAHPHLHFEIRIQSLPAYHWPSPKSEWPQSRIAQYYEHPYDFIDRNRNLGQPQAEVGIEENGTRHQEIVDCFIRNGGEPRVGRPQNRVHPWYATVWIQDFAGGEAGTGAIIQAHSGEPAYWVRGGNWNLYLNDGTAQQALSLPTSDEQTAGRSPYGTDGTYQHFRGGSLHFCHPFGTRYVIGDISRRFEELGGTNGGLGFPKIHTSPAGNSPYGTGGSYQVFEGGVMHHSSRYGARVTWNGPIRDYYDGQGGTNGALGFPVDRDEEDAATSPFGTTGRAATFEGGHVHSSRHGTFRTHGVVLNTYLATGGSGGVYGFPVEAQNGDSQRFEGGVIPAGFTLTSPNGGETWDVGSTQTIRWAHTGVAGNVRLEYSTNNGENWLTLTSSTPNDGAEAWTVPDRTTSQARFRVISVALPGISDTSDGGFTIRQPAPAAPDALIAVVGNGVVNLTWADRSGNETAFVLERKTGSGSFVTLTSRPANTTSYPDSTVAASTTYTYRVRAENATGASAFATSEPVTTPPPPSLHVLIPNGGEEWRIGENRSITWESTNLTGNVKLEVSRDGGTTWAALMASTANDGSETWAVTGPVTSQGRVRVSSLATPAVLDSSDGNFIISPEFSPPAAPSGLTATIVNSGRVDLSWTDHSADETGFQLERKTGAGDFTQLGGNIAANVTSYSDTTVSADATYTYRVRAVSVNGASAYSAAASVTLPPEPVNSPAEFRLGDGSAAPGTDATLDLHYLANGERTVQGQFDLTYDPDHLTFKSAATGVLPPGVGVVAHEPEPGRVTVFVGGVQATPWSDGVVARFTFGINASASTGSTSTVNVLLSDTSRQGVLVVNPEAVGKEATAAPGVVTAGSRFDLNRDGLVNAVDFQILVRAILQQIPRDAAIHDLNGDGQINAVDAQWLVDAILGRSAASSAARLSQLSPTPVGQIVPSFRLGTGMAGVGQSVTLPLQFTANGAAVTQAQFELHFDASRLSLTLPGGLAAAGGLPPGVSVAANQLAPGRVAVFIGGITTTTWSSGTILNATFQLSATAPPASSTSIGLSLPDSDQAGVLVVSPDAIGSHAVVEAGGITAASGRLGMKSLTLNFGRVRTGKAKSRWLVLRNTHRTQPLVVTIGTPKAPFEITEGAGTLTLPPRRVHRVRVRFTPMTRGPVTVPLAIISTDAGKEALTVRLIGRGK